MTDTETQVNYIIQAMVETGELVYDNDEKGNLVLKRGKNWGKKIKRPDIVAGKRIRWIKDE